MATSLATRHWLVHSAKLEEKSPWDKDIATMDVGLTGVSMCQFGGPCHEYRFRSDHLKEQLSLRVSSLATFTVGILTTILTLAAAGLSFTGRSTRVPRTALGIAVCVTGLAAVIFHGAGTSQDNFVTTAYGIAFHAGRSFYAMMAALAAAMATIATIASPRSP
jgi:hypothetical protein